MKFLLLTTLFFSTLNSYGQSLLECHSSETGYDLKLFYGDVEYEYFQILDRGEVLYEVRSDDDEGDEKKFGFQSTNILQSALYLRSSGRVVLGLMGMGGLINAKNPLAQFPIPETDDQITFDDCERK